jgi:predicted phage tail protein
MVPSSSPLSHKKRIILHGSLKSLHDGPLEVYADTVAEAIRYLSNKAGLNLLPLDKRPVVQVVGFDGAESLSKPTDVEEIHVLPAFVGSGGKSGGFMQIVIGAVLIAAVVFTGGFGLGFSSMLAGAAFSLGASLVLGGLMQMLAPAPNRDLGIESQADPEASRYLGAQGNTVAAGTRVPIIYGKTKAYGHYISFNVNAVDYIGEGA